MQKGPHLRCLHSKQSSQHLVDMFRIANHGGWTQLFACNSVQAYRMYPTQILQSCIAHIANICYAASSACPCTCGNGIGLIDEFL